MKNLKIGDSAPSINSVDQNGNAITLEQFKGKKVVLYFYPKDMTPGCTVQSCNLRDNYELLQKKGFELIGVSADSQKRQANFRNKYSFPFPLLADEDKNVIDVFGVWGPKKFMGREYDGIHRKTFIIDKKGMVSQVIDKVKTKSHASQILDHV